MFTNSLCFLMVFSTLLHNHFFGTEDRIGYGPPYSKVPACRLSCRPNVYQQLLCSLIVSSIDASTAHQSLTAACAMRCQGLETLEVHCAFSSLALSTMRTRIFYQYTLHVKPPMWIHPLPKQLFNIVLKSECVVRALLGWTFFPLWVWVKTSPPGAQVLPNPQTTSSSWSPVGNMRIENSRYILTFHFFRDDTSISSGTCWPPTEVISWDIVHLMK